MKKIKVIVIENHELKVKEIENTLHSLQKIVEGNIDIATRRIGSEKYYDFVLNDEGRLIGKEPSLLFSESGEDIVGNVVICNHDEEGNTIGLEEEEIEYILDNLVVKIHIQIMKKIYLLNGGY